MPSTQHNVPDSHLDPQLLAGPSIAPSELAPARLLTFQFHPSDMRGFGSENSHPQYNFGDQTIYLPIPSPSSVVAPNLSSHAAQVEPGQTKDPERAPPLDLQFILDSNSPGHDSDSVPAPGINQVVHPNVDDAIVNFDTESGSFPRRSKASMAPPAKADPYAGGFLREALSPEKYEVFSSRLFERRLNGTGFRPHKSSKDDGSAEVGDTRKFEGASVIDFLVKVEVVKEVLRNYVPHPYNPLKSLSHPYALSPNGQVTLTRSTILDLAGWSNTQFSYWARRSEAVSVLASLEPRLRAVGVMLDRHMRGTPATTTQAKEEENIKNTVTGKGLDGIVEEVKKRTGASQFIRGKHSSLDPFDLGLENYGANQVTYNAALHPSAYDSDVQDGEASRGGTQNHASVSQYVHVPPTLYSTISYQPPMVSAHSSPELLSQLRLPPTSNPHTTSSSPSPYHTELLADLEPVQRSGSAPQFPAIQHPPSPPARTEYFAVSDVRSEETASQVTGAKTSLRSTRSSKRKYDAASKVSAEGGQKNEGLAGAAKKSRTRA